jgi:predicted nucleic acid-binding protein
MEGASPDGLQPQGGAMIPALVDTDILSRFFRNDERVAARLYAHTRKQGTPVDDIDILIAGIALANDMAVVTANTDHFEKLPGLVVTNWAV